MRIETTGDIADLVRPLYERMNWYQGLHGLHVTLDDLVRDLDDRPEAISIASLRFKVELEDYGDGGEDPTGRVDVYLRVGTLGEFE